MEITLPRNRWISERPLGFGIELRVASLARGRGCTQRSCLPTQSYACLDKISLDMVYASEGNVATYYSLVGIYA